MRWIASVLACAGLLAVAVCASAAATLYKWVDDNGVVHYEDRPQPGAEKIHVNAAQTYKATPAPTVDSSHKSTPAASYSRVAIASPIAEQVFVNTGGSVPVAAELQPQLQPGHQLWFLLDGARVEGLSPSSTSATLDNVDRGEHSLAAQVSDAAGTPIITSAPVTFYVRIPSDVRQRGSVAPPIALPPGTAPPANSPPGGGPPMVNPHAVTRSGGN
jgi:Domain of unknown function (DUF4124)